MFALESKDNRKVIHVECSNLSHREVFQRLLASKEFVSDYDYPKYLTSVNNPMVSISINKISGVYVAFQDWGGNVDALMFGHINRLITGIGLKEIILKLPKRDMYALESALDNPEGEFCKRFFSVLSIPGKVGDPVNIYSYESEFISIIYCDDVKHPLKVVVKLDEGNINLLKDSYVLTEISHDEIQMMDLYRENPVMYYNVKIIPLKGADAEINRLNQYLSRIDNDYDDYFV